MLEKVWTYICSHGFFQKGDSVVVGVSGGADSMALLHILNSLSSRLKLSLHVAHLNHQLRGKEAQEDASFVKAAAESLDIPFTLGTEDVPAMVSREKLSVEEAARKARYNFLLATADKLGASKVAVAHNADDQAETFLMHLLHGTGLEGLAGMKPSMGVVVRPLLGVRRREIEVFCEQSGIDYRIDSTNADVAFLRNRIRHQLIPMLTEYNPNIVEALLRTTEIIRGENDYIEKETVLAAEKALKKTAQGLTVKVKAFADLDEALQRRLVRHVFRLVAGPQEQLEFAHVERVRDFIVAGQTGKMLELPKEVFTEKTYQGAVFGVKKNGACCGLPKDLVSNERWEDCSLMVPGTTDLPAAKAKIEAGIYGIEEVKNQVVTAASSEAYLDWDTLEPPVFVGPGKEGDRFHPLGSKGHKKLSDFFIDAKIEQHKRKLVPVVYDAKGIVWVAGMRIDDRVKVTGKTRQVLHLQIKSDRKAGEAL